MRFFQFRRTTLITCCLLAVLGGLGFARWAPGFPVTLALFLVALAVISVPKRKVGGLATVMICGFLLGWWRGAVYLKQLQPLLALSNQPITIIAQADDDAVYGDHSQLTFDVSHLWLEKPYQTELPGKISVAGFGETAVYKGDSVQITGKAVVSRGSRQMRMSFAQMEVVHRSASPVNNLRRRFTAGMESALPEPLASFAMGLLIGQRSTLPNSVSTALSTVGLTHVIAVSGYNLTIIMSAVRRLLRKRSKYQTFVISAVLILLFLLMTGLSASVVRAALVTLLSLLAWYYGRTLRPLLLIALVAAVTALWNPLYLWSDVGWYLSFLAFFGVLILAPLLNKRFFGTTEPRAIAGLLTETTSALLLTIPFVLYIFSQISLIAMVANMLVVPLVPLAMLLSLIAGLAGMLVPVLGGWLALPANYLLTYLLDLVQLISRWPYVLIKRQLPLFGMLFLYGCLMGVMVSLWHKQRQTGKITEIETEHPVERTFQMVND